MDALNINMLSEAELKELLDIRTQITKLQIRYDEIMKGSSSPAASKPVHTPLPSPSSNPPQPAPRVQPHTPVQRPAVTRPAAVYAPAATPRIPSAAPTQTANQTDPQDKIKVDSALITNLKQALIQTLTTAGKPLPFNSIYSKLEAAGVPLPEMKPMLVVRKILFDKALFDVVRGGLFQIKSETEITDSIPAPAPQPPSPVTAQDPAVTPRQIPAPQPQPQAVPQQNTAASFNSRLNAILNQ